MPGRHKEFLCVSLSCQLQGLHVLKYGEPRDDTSGSICVQHTVDWACECALARFGCVLVFPWISPYSKLFPVHSGIYHRELKSGPAPRALAAVLYLEHIPGSDLRAWRSHIGSWITHNNFIDFQILDPTSTVLGREVWVSWTTWMWKEKGRIHSMISMFLLVCRGRTGAHMRPPLHIYTPTNAWLKTVTEHKESIEGWRLGLIVYIHNTDDNFRRCKNNSNWKRSQVDLSSSNFQLQRIFEQKSKNTTLFANHALKEDDCLSLESETQTQPETSSWKLPHVPRTTVLESTGQWTVDMPVFSFGAGPWIINLWTAIRPYWCVPIGMLWKLT